MEFAVHPIAWIAVAGTPHRQGGAAVTAEEGGPPWGADWGEHAVARPGQAMQQPVAIEHRVAQAGGHQLLVEAFVIGAFRQPDPQGPGAHLAFMLHQGRAQLGPHRFGHLSEQGQVAVGGGAGDQIQDPQLL